MPAGAAAPADITFLPRAELRAMQDRLLRETIELCYRAHPFYARLMRREGLEPRHIQSCDDLVRLPPSGKADFLADPEAFRIDPAVLPPEVGTLWKVIYTTGTTTGRPAPVAVTTLDHFAYMHDIRRRSGFTGLGESDVIANLFPLTPFPMGAYARVTDEAAALGAGIVFAHTGRADERFAVHRSLDDAVRMVARHRATVLYGVAGFVRRVLIRAEEMGADFRSVRCAFLTGEASSDAMRADMADRMRRLGCAGDRVVNRYGATELGCSLLECAPGSGFHCLAPDQLFHEVVDAETGARLPDGTSGMLAFSHLMRRGTVFLRYKMGDVVALTHEPCPHCGRNVTRVVAQPVRTGDIVKIKGTLVNLQVLKDRLERLPAVHEYQIVIRRRDPADPFSQDELLLRLAVAAGDEDTVARHVAAETVEVAKVTPRIEFVAPDTIFDPNLAAKPRRVLDLRESG
jgi:phenylacetate-coenzyme A ligase PaaK-like adenylate-forming protein